jgi:hypothetical protein
MAEEELIGRRRREVRELDDWTRHVDEVLAELARGQGRIAESQRQASSAHTEAMRLVMLRLENFESRLTNLDLGLDPQERQELSEFLAQRVAEDVLSRVRSTRGRRLGDVVGARVAIIGVLIAGAVMILQTITILRGH